MRIDLTEVNEKIEVRCLSCTSAVRNKIVVMNSANVILFEVEFANDGSLIKITNPHESKESLL